MVWVSESNRVKKLLRVLFNSVQDYLSSMSKNSIQYVIELFEDITSLDTKHTVAYNSALFPLEIPKEYMLPSAIENVVSAVNFLASEKISVGAFDSSFFSLGPHLFLPLYLISVGYWYYDYHTNSGGDGCEFSGVSSLGEGGGIELELLVKDAEREVIKGLLERLKEKWRFIFFDEAFNLAYTLSWDAEKRYIMAEKVRDNIAVCNANGAIPVAVFYTRSRDLIRGITILTNKDLAKLSNLSDSMLMKMYIKNVGSRSPLFIVYSKPTQDVGLDLVSFYLRVDAYNIVRVEFPAIFRDMVDMIHLVVFSQIVLGNGFPLAMQRAHDLAVITRDERKIVEETIAELLKRPGIEYILSKKELSKRWPIA